MKYKLKEILSLSIWIILAILLCSLIGSCGTQKIATSEVAFTHDTVFVKKVSIDTLIQRDSIYHEVLVNGDTIHIKDYIFKYIYKPRIEYKDSIVYVNKLIDRIVTKEVAKPPTIWQKAKISLSSLLFFIIFTVLAWVIWKFVKR